MSSLKRPISPSADQDLPRPAQRHASPFLLESQLTNQLLSQKNVGDVGHGSPVNAIPGDVEVSRNGVRSLSKARSLSDTQPSLAPSPKLWETKKTTKDDTSVPSTPRRGLFPARGLSLQMPSNSTSHSTSLSFIHRAPLSPKLDSSSTYGAPASVLPRRSRGLDFSRACTNLHHSTLAEQPSPDSSPIMFGRGMSIPRKGFSSNGLDSPSYNSGSFWSIMGTTERAGISSSVGSVNMLDSDSGTSSSDDDELMDPDEDPIVMTPQAQRAVHSTTQTGIANPFGPVNASPGGDWMGNYSPAAASLMRFQRARRLRHERSRKSSSSGTASGSSAIPSPSPGSPPIKAVEGVGGSGYFAKELARKGVESRRESISLGTKELHLSSGGESDEGGMNGVKAACDSSGNASSGLTPGKDEKRGVIRRPVTRRGSLLVRLAEIKLRDPVQRLMR
ncbi:MAG: hypothetical protein M1813_000035 [Trichoglossum hirsutum]|nr:MAG: hypothetical protein M1813_000035 [Trichoglossum hirsutum]